MAERSGRAALIAMLDARAAAARPLRLWLRDDDAREATPALARLIAITAGHAVSPLIAAIPHGARPSLAEALAGTGARLAVHGIAHANHAPDGARKCELGHRPLAGILSELDAARASLAAIAGPALAPILVPPWNRIDEALVAHLPGLGFAALSAFGPRPAAHAAPGLARINTHLDIIDWRGTRATLPQDSLFATLASAGGTGTGEGAAGDEPIGILTHHLVHDDAAWRFLDALLEMTGGHPGARWLDAGELAGAVPAGQAP